MKRDTLVLIIALACGIAAFSLIFNFLKQASLPQSQFVVAKGGLPKGKVLTAEDLTVSAPVKNVPREKYFTQINDLIGMRLENDIPQGGMIERGLVKKVQAVIAKIAPKRVNTEQNLPVPPSMRALTLNLQDLENVPGVLTAGDYVDILGNVVLSNSQREIRTILYAVSVIGIQRMPPPPVASASANDSEEKARGAVEGVTLALLPAQVETVLNASKLGKMRLVINSREGNQSAWSNVGSIEIIRGVLKERKST